METLTVKEAVEWVYSDYEAETSEKVVHALHRAIQSGSTLEKAVHTVHMQFTDRDKAMQ